MRKIAVFIFCLYLFEGIVLAQAETRSYSWADKLTRGLLNIVASPLEIPRSVTNVTTHHGPAQGWTLGLVSGLGRTLFRAGLGAVDVLTFPFDFPNDGKAPMMQPVYPWQNWEDPSRYH